MKQRNELKLEKAYYLQIKSRAGLRLALTATACFAAVFATLLCLGVALVSLIAALAAPATLFLFLYATLFCLACAPVAGFLYSRTLEARRKYSEIVYVSPVEEGCSALETGPGALYRRYQP